MKKFLWPVISAILLIVLLLPAAALAGVESLSLSDYQVGATPEYRINYRLGGSNLSQADGDYISLFFSNQIELPINISPEDILINSVTATKIRTYKDWRRVDVFIPADLAANEAVDILIKPGAGIKNPPAPSTYTLGVQNSQLNVVSECTYSVVPGSISSPRVDVKPAVTGVASGYTISFRVSRSGGLSGLSGDTVNIAFPQEVTIPSNIKMNSISVNGRDLDSEAWVLPGNKLVLNVPAGVSVGPEGQVVIEIKPEANIKNPARAGEYKFELLTSKDPIAVTTEAYSITESTASALLVNVKPLLAGAEARYEISFKTSSHGALVGGRDVISIVFPEGRGLPDNISTKNIRVQGEVIDTGAIKVKDRSVSFTVPSGASVGAGQPVNIIIDKEAYIKNPQKPGSYDLKISTTGDQQTIVSNQYQITGGSLIKLTIDNITARVDGKPLYLEAPAKIINGRTMVPARFVAETLGAKVDWDSNTREVTISFKDKTIKMTVDSRIATVNGNRVGLDAAPVILQGRTLVPIRFITENLGCEVTWDATSRTVTIKN